MKQIMWENLTTELGTTIRRSKVPTGWLVIVTDDVQTHMHGIENPPEQGYECRSSICFVYDPYHYWLNDDAPASE